LFPNSKFIYTLRPLEDWQASVIAHFTFRLSKPDLRALQADFASRKEFRHGRKYKELYGALLFGRDDLAESFRAYDRRVRNFFADKPKERMLEFDVFAGDGWSKSCAFLGVEVPPIDFPKENVSPDRAGRDSNVPRVPLRSA
jgi:hypothetical protein